MLKNISVRWGIALTLCIVMTACSQSPSPIEVPLQSLQQYGDTMNLQENRKQLIDFIEDHLSGSFGVMTNFRDSEQNGDLATGHEVLSESAGIMMRYYALTNHDKLFEATWQKTKQTFNLSTGFSYRYSPQHTKLYSVNAAVDDLRIIRSLYEAGHVFGETRYIEEADANGQRFYKFNVKDDFLYDFYDETYRMTNNFVTLCYIDLVTLQKLPIETKQMLRLHTNMLRIIEEGYLSDTFPFYETLYDYSTEAYHSEHINTVESLLTILSLSEVQKHNPQSIIYLKEQVEKGELYGQYTTDGMPTTDVQSTAIYAITAMIGSILGDRDLYEMSIYNMNNFQVHDSDSPLFGGFGHTASLQVYSFDNLMALLAYTY